MSSNGKELLENARECFRQAAEAPNPRNMKLLVELGLEYLRIALADPAYPNERAGDDEIPARLN
jgi:hypothetical protein